MGVVFVYLGSIGEAHGPELRVDLLCAYFFCGELCEAARKGGVLAAGNAQHISLESGVEQVVREEVHTRGYLVLRIDGGGDVEAALDVGAEVRVVLFIHDNYGNGVRQSGLLKRGRYDNMVPRVIAGLCVKEL